MLNSQPKNRLHSASCGLNGEVDAEHIATTPPPQPNSCVKSTGYETNPALLNDVRKFAGLLRHGTVSANDKIFGTAETNTLKTWCLFGFPVLTRQYNPNFKVKWHIGPWPLVSLSRCPSLRKVKLEVHNRPTCLYLSLGSLPFYDNGSGIPRVAKNLCREGLTQADIKFVPVYPDPCTGVYRRADSWCIKQGLLPATTKAIDAEITVKPGDWLVQTMINANALEFDAGYFESFRAAGGYLGVILHDIIAEEHPEFFKPRDSRNFSRWLRRITSFDGIFAVSKATEDTFNAWKVREGIASSAQTGHFHLGANFKSSSDIVPVQLSAELTARPLFLQVSTLEPRKGYAQLISAFETLWAAGVDVNLALVGRKGWMVAGLIRRIKKHPELNRRLFWFSYATDAELVALYKHATAVVVASEAEGFGLSVVEGLWHGRPVIARDIPVFREVGGDSLTYFIGNSPETIAVAVRSVLKHPQSGSIATLKTMTWAESFSAFADVLHKFSSNLKKGAPS